MTYITLTSKEQYMKQWHLIKNRKNGWKEFKDLYVPEILKIPVVGKIAICTLGDEQAYRTITEIKNTCMIVEIGKDGDDKDYINVLQNENIITILYEDLNDWLYCPITTKLSGKAIAITGPTVFPRTVYQNFIELSGGEYKTTVGRKTTHLINSTPGETTKIKRARQQGVQLISEVDFFKMIA